MYQKNVDRASPGCILFVIDQSFSMTDPFAGTPKTMCDALNHCYRVAGGWCEAHPGSFPPVVIHLTDGESSDGNPEEAANGLKSLFTGDGNLLLFNCHLSDSTAVPVLFPSSEDQLPD